jgi:hypothetical protein
MADDRLTVAWLEARGWGAKVCDECQAVLGKPPDQTRVEQLDQLMAHMELCPASSAPPVPH